ncbi:MAG: DUF3794 domain-containing protein [Clostridiales bacterium]|nr:DUF3794 domain-containing protein [Clostridiales bacterium]
MPVDIIKDEMILKCMSQKESSQVLAEGDIIVPDMKPDMDFILRVSARPFTDEIKTNDGRVTFRGRMEVHILYQGKNCQKPVNSMTSILPFEDFLIMDAAGKSSEITAEIKTEHIEYSVINDRKLSVKAVLMVTAEAWNEKRLSFIRDVAGDEAFQVKKDRFCAMSCRESVKDRFAVKEEVNLPSQYPEIDEILDTEVFISEEEIRPADGKVLIKGILNVSTIYSGIDDTSIIETVENEIPFHGFVEAKEATEEAIALAKLRIDQFQVRAMADDDGTDHLLEVEASISVDMKIIEEAQKVFAQDMYTTTGNIEINTEEISFPEMVGRNDAKGVLKESFLIDGKYPEILRVEKVFGSAQLEEVTVKDDIVTAEGVVNLEIMYIAGSDDAPVSVVPVAVPFEQTIEVRGVKEGMQAEVSAGIEGISFSMLSDREVEIVVTMGYMVYVVDNQKEEVISQVIFEEGKDPELKKIASIVIYVAQKGDSLWNIAKRYRTTVDNILKFNEIDNPNLIYPGQKLLIVREIPEAV